MPLPAPVPSATLADALHGLFVLLTTCSYLLPAWEGVQRKSAFYTALFALLLLVSFVLHIDETGLSPEPLSPLAHERLHDVSLSLSYFLATVLLLVVLELRAESEVLGRIVAGVWAAVVWATGPGALARNVGATVAIGVVVLLVDVAVHKRRFAPSYWRRLGLIAAMGGVGGLLFRLLRVLWVWHGLWHLYLAVATYLLLLAQRRKSELVAARGGGGRGSAASGGGGGGWGSGGLLGSAPGGGGGSRGHSSTVDGGMTTPVKRAGRGFLGLGGGTPAGGAGAGAGGGTLVGAAAALLPGTPPGRSGMSAAAQAAAAAAAAAMGDMGGGQIPV
jgi:hypothetical protein